MSAVVLLSLQKPSLQRSLRHAFYKVDLKIIWKVHSTFQLAENVGGQLKVKYEEDTKVIEHDVCKVRKAYEEIVIDDLCIIHLEASAIL